MRQRLIQEHNLKLVVIDPVSSLARGVTAFDVSAMLMRQVYDLKAAGITAIMTVLSGEGGLDQAITNISSLVDTVLEVVILSGFGERNRGLYVLKSRGMAHSNQIREFLLSDSGVDVIPVVIAPNGVLTGSARIAAESAERRRPVTVCGRCRHVGVSWGAGGDAASVALPRQGTAGVPRGRHLRYDPVVVRSWLVECCTDAAS